MDPETRTLTQVTIDDAAARRPTCSRCSWATRSSRGASSSRRTPASRTWTSDPGGDDDGHLDLIGGGNIEPRALEDEMRTSYLDYAMSVIVGRALPDVRDGLKPVHRRVLYAMNEAGLQPNRPYSKCARDRRRRDGQLPPARRLGDLRHARAAWRRTSRCATRSSTARATSAPSTTTRAAAMRYTEARLTPLAREMLRDLDADTVDFAPNYDGSQAASRSSCRRASRTCSSTARPASPSAWRRTSRRTTCARSIARGRSPTSTTRRSTPPA